MTCSVDKDETLMRGEVQKSLAFHYPSYSFFI